MSRSSITTSTRMLFVSFVMVSMVVVAYGSNFYHDFYITWGDGRAKILNNGELVTLSLDKASGSGFQSKNEYLFGEISMQLKLVPGNSAGSVTTFYLTSQGPTHNEVDFEFIGNLGGDPYILSTNLFTQGKGEREQQFLLWFDPTVEFHTYSILWNPINIILYVDGTPIRVFKNLESSGVPFPKSQAMSIDCTFWYGGDWATGSGRLKTDWSLAPFIASYRGFSVDACVWSSGTSYCSPGSASWMSKGLDTTGQDKLTWVRNNYMFYDYCKDTKRFPEGLPKECSIT